MEQSTARCPRPVPPRPQALLAALAFLAASGCAASGAHVDDGAVRVALCQIECVDGDAPGNLLRIEQALAEAARMGADLACFPETVILGWVNPEAHARADPIPGPTAARLGALARRHGVMLAVGLAEKDGDALYDSALLFGRDGRVLLKRRKVNVLTELMEPPYAPGSLGQVAVAQTAIGRVGMLICADVFRDDVVRGVAAEAPDLLVVPFGWAAPARDWPEHGRSLASWVAHTARRVGCAVIGVDLVGTITHGPWTGYQYGGQSVACDRDGSELVLLPDRAAAVRVITLAGPRQTVETGPQRPDPAR